MTSEIYVYMLYKDRQTDGVYVNPDMHYMHLYLALHKERDLVQHEQLDSIPGWDANGVV